MDLTLTLLASFYLFVGSLFIYLVGLSVYRLYFSPIRAFPGPRLAALTFWYEFYFDVYLQGRYSWKIQELHRRYGPIVRINPEEIHIQDCEFYEKLYVGNRRTDKWHWSAKMFGTTTAAVGTVNHDLHRLRRSALNPFFSKQSVGRLEERIQSSIDNLYSRLCLAAGSGKPVNLSDALTCLSADVIAKYTFGESYYLIERDEFAPEWRRFMTDLSRSTHIMKQAGWGYLILTTLPESLVALFHPLSKALFKLRRGISDQIETIKEIHGKTKQFNRETIFHGLLFDTHLPSTEKSTSRLIDEGLTIIGAGTVTTAHTLAVIFFHLLSEPGMLDLLHAELDCAMNGRETLSWDDLSNLPYLSAIVNEGLRLSFGVSHRLQRVSPDTALQYKEWVIPPGTPVSMTQMFIMTDPSIFPRPNSFLPERWLDPQIRDKYTSVSPKSNIDFPSPRQAKKYLIPFSRGSRACLGMNLAYSEIFLTLGTLLRPVKRGGLDWELFDTSALDMETVHDFFNPSPRLESKGLRVLVR